MVLRECNVIAEGMKLMEFKLKQKIAVADVAGWYGDGVTEGIVGFAYPSL